MASEPKTQYNFVLVDLFMSQNPNNNEPMSHQLAFSPVISETFS